MCNRRGEKDRKNVVRAQIMYHTARNTKTITYWRTDQLESANVVLQPYASLSSASLFLSDLKEVSKRSCSRDRL